jgi:hypothetical protein
MLTARAGGQSKPMPRFRRRRRARSKAVTPSDVYSWLGPDVHLTWQSERTGIENKWFALTGRVVELRLEADGDLHIALQDATGDKPGIVVCEVPPKRQWCEIRTTIFSWTRTRFPFHTSSAKKLNVDQPPVITVMGKAFWDMGHASKDQSNRRAVEIDLNWRMAALDDEDLRPLWGFSLGLPPLVRQFTMKLAT